MPTKKPAGQKRSSATPSVQGTQIGGCNNQVVIVNATHLSIGGSVCASSSDGDPQAEKFGHCRHLMLTAQSYAESMNQLAFKGGSERTAKENRKDFLKDWKGCESALAG